MSNGHSSELTMLEGMPSPRVLSALVSRIEFATKYGFQYGGDRNLYEALGYPRTLSVEDYKARYTRGGIAKRIIKLKPEKTWASNPRVFETESPNDRTKWEKAWTSLTSKVPVFASLRKLDTLAGIGEFGILLIGMRDGKKLELEAEKLRGPDDIIYLQAYAQDKVSISKVDEDVSSPRYGLPLMYEVKHVSPSTTLGGNAARSKNLQVHWTRVIHFADEADENEIYGTPRLEPIWNLLDDLIKVVGGGGEMFWRGGYMGIQADVDKDAALKPAEEDALEEEFKKYEHRMKRFIQTRRVKMTPLGSNIADPRGTFSVIAANISSTLGIPQRIIFGSERGELASSQDREELNVLIADRQRNVAWPLVLLPFIQRMAMLKALPEPKRELTCEWPDLSALSDDDRAQIVERLTRAEQQHATAEKSGTTIFTEDEIRELVGYEPLTVTGNGKGKGKRKPTE
jgi:uncharacterized protein